MTAPRRDPEVRRRRGEEGYNLVLLMVIVTALNVLVAAALPSWSAFEQREAEEELIFRGLQYAEAIRVFQARFGRLPVRLEELIEVEPRSIRQLWVDPITGEQNWGLLFGDPSNPGNCAPNPADQVDTGLSSGFNNGRGETVTQGPICGVYSRADGDAIKTFMGATSYEEWHFTLGLLVGQGQAPQNPQD
ncbi:MAG TPA: type II secretion system protein, partial [Thermoanaerobaculia bacterium]|nr:type II secretion system protein [Thermoanaerobaculia bacterium]